MANFGLKYAIKKIVVDQELEKADRMITNLQRQIFEHQDQIHRLRMNHQRTRDEHELNLEGYKSSDRKQRDRISELKGRISDQDDELDRQDITSRMIFCMKKCIF